MLLPFLEVHADGVLLGVFYRGADAAKATPCGGPPRSLREVQPEAAEQIVFVFVMLLPLLEVHAGVVLLGDSLLQRR